VFGAAAFRRGIPVSMRRVNGGAVRSLPADLTGRRARVGWKRLRAHKATKCIHLVPTFGRIGSRADMDALARYFAALDGHVRTLLAAGVGLAELPARCDLPEFAPWDGYAALHVQNANSAYLRMERDSSIDGGRDGRAFRNKV